MLLYIIFYWEIIVLDETILLASDSAGKLVPFYSTQGLKL